MCLATMAYVYAACAARFTIFSIGDKFRPVSNFMELHALTPAARSYALLIPGMRVLITNFYVGTLVHGFR